MNRENFQTFLLLVERKKHQRSEKTFLYTILFLPDQSGENKNKYFTCGKIKNADEIRFVNC